MISTFFQSVLKYVIVSTILVFSSLLRAEESTTFYFYNPEVNTVRNTVLKGTFDQYFATQGGYQFQPVTEKNVFEALAFSNQADALIMSSNHFAQLLEANSRLSEWYVSVLQGEKNGSDTYLKLLVSKDNNSDLSGRTLASSRNQLVTLNIIERMFPNQTLSKAMAPNILEVPKDIDALMAVGFGLADMALTTDDSLSVLSDLYEDQYEQVAIIGKSIPQKRMVLVLSRSSIDNGLLLGEMIYSMPQSSAGRRAMKLIGLDSWRWQLEGKSSRGGEE